MKKIKLLFKIDIITLFFLIVAYAGIYLVAYLFPKLPIDTANNYYFYDNLENLYAGNSSKEWISLNEMSPYLVNATVAVEDKNFFEHNGFDFLRIIKSLFDNITSGETTQGASTITQQYAKNLFLDFDRTWERKIEEAWLTVRLEMHYSKEEILEGYLNTINYGGIFGIENASQYYFDKSASDLTLAEASMLAGIPKWPSAYSPLVDENAAKNRQWIILDAMVQNGYITEEEMEEAYNVELVYSGETSSNNLSTLMYYQDAVIEELQEIEAIPSSFLTTGGLKIYTNLDMEAQNILDASILENMKENQEIQVASVVMDPNTGKVLALAGGRDYSVSQYNRATSSKRQVGSTLKPFLYYAALENGFTPSTTFVSEPTTFTFSGGNTYSPENYANIYGNKPISMLAALTYSDNIYAVKTHLFLGEETLVNMASRVGITTKLEAVPSLALGSNEINIMEMMTAYATLANEGYKVKAHFITRVEDMNGNVLYEYTSPKEAVLNKSLTFILNEMLSNCYASDMIDYNSPTCLSIRPQISKKYAIKSGSTDTDSLVFGFNPEVLVGVWVGYDDNQIMTTADHRIAKQIWVKTIEGYLEDKEKTWYTQPSNVVGVLVDPISGLLATEDTTTKKLLYYIKGTEPTLDEIDLDDLVPTVKEE
ncbi:MAG: PBP1A family penicillin-binding protein [Bacilli bacterium]|nr:PBP1A family penicillin-binding protein [Bacilli bacterium]